MSGISGLPNTRGGGPRMKTQKQRQQWQLVAEPQQAVEKKVLAEAWEAEEEVLLVV